MFDKLKPPHQRIRVTVVSHTHWDRAWYVPFQEFRARLVRLVDRLLDLLENCPDYKVYMLDGQMAVLEDYLEVRPSQSARLQAHCRSGRIKIGPWYVLADEFLVSPEALIRNLMLGHQMGREYGGVFKIGYVPDGFGHIAQLPQILRGFGIDNAFFWRGVGSEGDSLGTEFEWRAPDGSTVTAIWMPWGYHNISNIGYPIHWGDTSQMEFCMDLALAQIEKAVQALQPFARTPALLLMNGIDHAEPEPRLPDILERARQKFPDTDFENGTVMDHLNRVRAAHPVLPSFEGEFRWGRYSEILQGVYATRIYLKQANFRLETLFQTYVEPIAALAWLAGADVPPGLHDLIWTGWRWLLKNHPHDDIYGSGIDVVHEEMIYRFNQAEQIGNLVVRDSLRMLANQAGLTSQNGMPVLVYNFLAWARNEMVVGDIDFDFDDPVAGDFHMVDGQGNPIPCQVLSDSIDIWMETLKANRKRRIRVSFPAIVPACGYSTFYVQPGQILSQADWGLHENGAENRFLAFEIHPDGGLDITDKTNGEIYKGLHHFNDVDDAGDEYSFCPCKNSLTFSTKDNPASISRISIGPNQVTFRVLHCLTLPESLSFDRQHRSDKTVEVLISSEFTLYRDRPGLFIQTEVNNKALDHKLSVLFPSGLNPVRCAVDESFAVIERDIDLPVSTGWVEDPTPLMHQRSFVDLSDGKCGLAIFNRGLPAVEVTRVPTGAQISLVLLRSVGWLSREDLSNRRVTAGPMVPTPGAQCVGKYRFEYAIYLHSDNWRSVYQQAYAYVNPLLLARADTHEGLELHEMNITRDDPKMVKRLLRARPVNCADSASFIDLQPHTLVLSAVKRSEDGSSLVIRFYNVTRDPVYGRLVTGFPLHGIARNNLNEEFLEDLVLDAPNTVSLKVGPAEIVTLRLTPEHFALLDVSGVRLTR